MTLAGSGKVGAIDYFRVSRNGKYICFGMSLGGSEESVLQILDVDTGKILNDRIDRAWNAAPQWRADNSSFYYRRGNKLAAGASQSAVNQKLRTYLHVLGRDPETDKPIFGFGVHPDISLGPDDMARVFVMPSTRYAIAGVWRGVEDNFAVWIAPIDTLEQAHPPWRKLIDYSDEVTNLDCRGDFLYFVTRHNTPHSKILRVRMDAISLAQSETIVPASDLFIESVSAAADALYVQGNEGGLGRLLSVDYATKPRTHRVELPIEGTLSDISADVDAPGALFRMESWVRPPTIFVTELDKGTKDSGLLPAPKIDVTRYVEEEVRVPSTGGTRVPLSIVRARDLKLDGRNPTWMTAYGAYGDRYDASFQPAICLQVPSVLLLKSGQVQKFSPTSKPRTVTVYWPPVCGLLTRYSEKTRFLPTLSIWNFSSRARCRRMTICSS